MLTDTHFQYQCPVVYCQKVSTGLQYKGKCDYGTSKVADFVALVSLRKGSGFLLKNCADCALSFFCLSYLVLVDAQAGRKKQGVKNPSRSGTAKGRKRE
eukprot:2010919-Rhodomonas_salina.2